MMCRWNKTTWIKLKKENDDDGRIEKEKDDGDRIERLTYITNGKHFATASTCLFVLRSQKYLYNGCGFFF